MCADFFTLEDSWTKHARGVEHLDALWAECEAYLSGGPAFSAEHFHDAATGTVGVQFHAEPPPPPRLGAIVGDIAHNLRSALDVAAWQLALANDEASARQQPNLVQFPLASTVEGFAAGRAANPLLLQRLSADRHRASPAVPLLVGGAGLAAGTLELGQAPDRHILVHGDQRRDDIGSGRNAVLTASPAVWDRHGAHRDHRPLRDCGRGGGGSQRARGERPAARGLTAFHRIARSRWDLTGTGRFGRIDTSLRTAERAGSGLRDLLLTEQAVDAHRGID